eukprot:CAMPEP_0194250080 /NCGR_PEP_ID=MMETSP0158-20130606/22034_1 /TAXON_ID=33649 /ORGANISM="Thalassionema nitzschioides, Strain L26-B" /LENGTH=468 /DNA_ID=CAMNT_0038986761 /DNA_START=100 /DNA_END=1506 /DNA_ORIENTATION=-
MEVDGRTGDDVVMGEDLDEGSLSDDLSDDLEPTQPTQPAQRRLSMSEDEERQRRASIKAILADDTIPEPERRRSIQHLMDGRRNSRSGASTPSVIETEDVSLSNGNTNQNDHQPVPSEDLLQGSFSQLNYVVTPVSNEQTKRFELTRPECTHYDRQCTMIAPCCGAAFGCRICHDDCPILPPKVTIQQARRRYPRSSSLPSSFTNMNQTPEDTHHTIDRFAIREVICRKCYSRQSSKTNNCVNCGIQFGEYHCNICNLWMSGGEKPYHCADCGFCRVGGAENFQHCHDCGMCIDRTLYDNHNCKVGKYKSNCPVCQEYLFSSRSASHEMPCGHAIHWDCFRQLAAHDSRCPVCKKTAETKERMLPTWNAMAAGVALQPVPPELARVVNIQCNDCEEIDYGRAWHFLGVQCRNCSSFNTVVDRIVMSGEEAHNFLEAMVQREQFSGPFDLDAPTSSNNRRRVSRRRSHI